MTKANVYYSVDGGKLTIIEGEDVGLRGTGGASHAEQKVWPNVRDIIKGHLKAGRPVSVTFKLDTLICAGCAPWFETTVYNALNDAAEAGRTTFTLRVEAFGLGVIVEGARTIWLPEMAEVPTFDRLSSMERSMRYLRDGRDETGKLSMGQDNPHVAYQVAKINEHLEAYQNHGLTLNAIGNSMSTARASAVRKQQGRFDEQAAKETLDSYLRGKTFSEIVASGGFTVPDMSTESNLDKRVNTWLRLLEQRLTEWMEISVEDHFEAYEYQKDYPHQVY